MGGGGGGNMVLGKKMALRRKEIKSEQAEKLENEQHGSTELKTTFLKATMCPLVPLGNRKHFFKYREGTRNLF